MTFTLEMDINELASKFDQDTKEFKKNSDMILENMAQEFMDAVGETAQELVEPWKGLYAASFRDEVTADTITITNVAKNIHPGGEEFEYAWIIEWGMEATKTVPLIKYGEITSIGRWAIDKLGFVEHTTRRGNLYLKAPDGKLLTRMSVQPPARHPMREGFYEGQRRIQEKLPKWLGLEK